MANANYLSRGPAREKIIIMNYEYYPMNVSFVTLPETYLSTLRGVNQTITCIVFCPNHFDSAARIDVDKLPELGGGATDPPDPRPIRLCI